MTSNRWTKAFIVEEEQKGDAMGHDQHEACDDGQRFTSWTKGVGDGESSMFGFG